MAKVRLTLAAKLFIAAVIIGVVGLIFYLNPGLLGKVAPKEQNKVTSNIPPVASLPGDPSGSASTFPTVADAPGGCTSLPEVRFQVWAWNAQMGMMLATGGKQAVAGSAMCAKGVNLKLIREDNTDNMQAALVAFAEALSKGDANPKDGVHFVGIMGDGGAQFLKGLNDKLVKLGPDYIAQVVGSDGYSRGEDKLMGPAAWKANPQAARGGLVAGVLRDGDWNIALKWLGDNKIPNNPDETTYDPDALNWVNASDYIEAAQKYVSGFCTDMKNIKTGQKEKHCVERRRHLDARRRDRGRAEGRPRLDRVDQASTARRCRTWSSASRSGCRRTGRSSTACSRPRSTRATRSRRATTRSARPPR